MNINFGAASYVLIWTTMIIWVGYNIFPALNTVNDDTISEQLRYITERWWVLPFIWGVLAGHWWGPLDAPIVRHGQMIGVALIGSSFAACKYCPWTVPPKYWSILVIGGFLIGATVWATQIRDS